VPTRTRACTGWLPTDPISTASGGTHRHREGWRSRGRGDQPHSALLARSAVAHEPCDLRGAIREVLPLVGPEMRRHDVLLETSLAPDLPPVMGDRIQLQQVLLNLLLNAAEAMREVLPVRRRMVVRATADHRDDGPWAIVAVEDAGVGFGEAEAPRLFEAFYTTKPGGLGMGSRSAARSSTATGVGSGPRRTLTTAPPSTSRCRGCHERGDTVVFVVDDDRSIGSSYGPVVACCMTPHRTAGMPTKVPSAHVPFV